MEIVADASAFLAVLLDEESREWVIERTSGYGVVSPEILPYEIANALINVRRKGRLTEREVLKAFSISQRIAVKLLPVKISEAMKLALKFGIYAYDAFYIQCSLETKLPLISLDSRMCEIATSLSIKVVT
jgi:predicted nucleic acid-binding protein